MELNDYKEIIRTCSPVDMLEEEYFENLINKSELIEAVTGDFFFESGDSDRNYYFLLKGDVELVTDDDTIIELISAGSEQAKQPLSPAIPRKANARASSIVALVCRIPSDMLDIMLTWEKTGQYETAKDMGDGESAEAPGFDNEADVDDFGPEVSEDGGGENDGDDWMTMMLQNSVFQRIPAANIQAALMRMSEVNFKAGETVCEQNSEGDYFYIIKTGACAVIRKLTTKGKVVKLADLLAGETFGEEALISNKKRNASIVMTHDGTLMRLSKDDFLSLMNQPVVQYIETKEAVALHLKEKAIWIDTRLPNEYMLGHLKNSVNVPLVTLRMKLKQMDIERKYLLYCDNGSRSSAAAFLMSSRGFDSYVLQGGMESLPASILEKSD